MVVRLKNNFDTRLLILLILVFLVHFPLLFNDFHTDDFLILKIMRDGFDWQAFKHMENPFNFRPLTNLIVFARYHLLGETPVLWYLLNICLHLSITAFIYRMLRDRLDCSSAFFGALFFGIYFPHFEAVIWLYGIVRLFLALLILIAWKATIRNSETGTGGNPYAPAITFLAALLIVEDALLLFPFFMILSIRSPVGADTKKKQAFGFAAATAIYLLLRLILTGRILNESEQYYPGVHILTNIYHYAGWLLLPQFDHPYLLPFVEKHTPFITPLITPVNIAVFAAALLIAAIIVYHGSAFEKTALLFVAISLLPALPLNAKACSRLLYLPSIGVAFLAGSLWQRASIAFPALGKKIIIGIAALYFIAQSLANNLTIRYYHSLQAASAAILKKIDDMKIDFNRYAYVIVDHAPGRSRPWTPFRLRYGYRGEVRARNEAYEKQIDLDSLMVELEKSNINYIAIDCRDGMPKISRIFDPRADSVSSPMDDSP